MHLALPRRLLPHSLRWQFRVAVGALALLILAGAATALYALRASTTATRQLASERLARVQDAQDLVQHTLLIERETYLLLNTSALDAVKLSYDGIVGELTALDASVARFAARNPDVNVLDLHQASQLFRNTAHIVARLRVSTLQNTADFTQAVDSQIEWLQSLRNSSVLPLSVVLYRLRAADETAQVQPLREEFALRRGLARQAMGAGASTMGRVAALDQGAQDPFELRVKLLESRAAELLFHEQLKRQSLALVSVARQQSLTYTREYRDAMQELVETANRNQTLLLVLLAASLLAAWLITQVFLGRHVLARLRQVSRHLRRGDEEPVNPVVPVAGQDEIGDMARAVEQFMRDRQQLAVANKELASALATLNLAKEELVRSEKLAALGAMVAGIAHELNTPIGNSLMVASTLVDRTREFAASYHAGLTRATVEAFVADADFACDILMRSLRRAADLVTSFKQVAVDQASSQRREFKLADVVAENIQTLSPAIRKRHITVSQNIPEDVKLDSFPGPLGQALVNLVNNALIHGFEGRDSGTIDISAVGNLESSTVEITVKDDGVGIPPENLGRVFDPFFTTRMGLGGSGLGLNIVHNIVTGLLGGRIQVHSEVGVETTFSLLLPLVAPHCVAQGQGA